MAAELGQWIQDCMQLVEIGGEKYKTKQPHSSHHHAILRQRKTSTVVSISISHFVAPG